MRRNISSKLAQMFAFAAWLAAAPALARPPFPLESSREEIGAVLKFMKNENDGILSLTTPGDGTYVVTIKRWNVLCTIDILTTRMPIPGGPSDYYDIKVTQKSIRGPLPLCDN